jgi:hypothetical protein
VIKLAEQALPQDFRCVTPVMTARALAVAAPAVPTQGEWHGEWRLMLISSHHWHLAPVTTQCFPARPR